eukprot:m51a1_g2718 hypothetical protein (134) ;mRNA; r:848120-848665
MPADADPLTASVLARLHARKEISELRVTASVAESCDDVADLIAPSSAEAKERALQEVTEGLVVALGTREEALEYLKAVFTPGCSVAVDRRCQSDFVEMAHAAAASVGGLDDRVANLAWLAHLVAADPDTEGQK